MSKSRLRMQTKGLNTLEEIDENHKSQELIDEFPQTNFDGNSTMDSDIIHPQKILNNRTSTVEKLGKIPSRSSSSMSNRNRSKYSKKFSSIQSIDENLSTYRTEEIDYDELVPVECNLSAIKFSNEYEQNLITRIYSRVANLSSYLSDFNRTNLQFYLNQPDQHKFMPLYYAIKSDNLETVKYLLTIGSNAQRTTAKGDPATHLACLIGTSVELIEYLLSFDKDLYKVDQDGWNVLHCACNQGHLYLVKYLIEKKFMNLNIKDTKTKLTGLQLAAINDRHEIIDYLLNFSSSSIVINQQTTENIYTSNRPKSVKITSKLCAENLNTFNEEFNTQLKSQMSDQSSTAEPGKNLISSIYESTCYRPSMSGFKFNNSVRRYINVQRKNSLMSVEKSTNENSNKDCFMKKPQQVRNVLEPVSVYRAMNRYVVEPLAIYKHQLVNLKSYNNDGHNVFHLACLYGRYDSVSIILKKFGSNQLDINKTDFKGRTCMDLAWNWLMNVSTEEIMLPCGNILGENSFLYSDNDPSYSKKNLEKLDRKISEEIKLIHLLNQYGAKFSSPKILYYNFEPIKKSQSRLLLEHQNIKEHKTKIRFHPKENKMLIYDLKMQEKSNGLASIIVFLKSILYLFKLNLPTMFLKEKYFTKLDEFKNMIPRKFSCDSNDSSSSDSTTNTKVPLVPPVSESTQLKKDLAKNLHDLIEFIRCEIDDKTERQIYFENIQTAFEYLSNI